MRTTVLVLGLSVLGFGCGGGTDSTSTTTSSSATTGSTAGGGGMGGAGGDATGTTTGTGGAGGDATGPMAPMMESAEPLGGALHVMWTNVTPDCDKIRLYRKHDAGEYAVAYTLAGAANSQHDTGAKPPGMYCYKATCEKGGQTSPDSNEKCGTP